MKILDFITKYDLGWKDTVYFSKMTETQLNEFKTCEEFADVKTFNVTDPNDSFFQNNAIDFRLVPLKDTTTFNKRINLVSINIFGPFGNHDVYDLPDGFSMFRFVDEKELKNKGGLVFKFDYNEVSKNLLSTDEIRFTIAKYLKEFSEDLSSKKLDEDKFHQYYYLIGIRCHKDSILEDTTVLGETIKVPEKNITKELKIFPA